MFEEVALLAVNKHYKDQVLLKEGTLVTKAMFMKPLKRYLLAV